MSEYTPDRWVVVEMVSEKETILKVFAGWYGGFTGSDSWQLNSGIAKVRQKDQVFEFDGYSGSIYYCHKNSYGMSGYMASVLSGWQKKFAERPDIKIRVLDLEEVAVF